MILANGATDAQREQDSLQVQGPKGADSTAVPLWLQSSWRRAALALQGFVPADCTGFSLFAI